MLKIGGLIVDRKEVKYGLVDQMSREEVEKRLQQLLGQTIEGQLAEDDSTPVPVLDTKDEDKKNNANSK